MTRHFEVTNKDSITEYPYPDPDPEFAQRMLSRKLRYEEWRRNREALARRPSARMRRFAAHWFSLIRWGIGDSIVKLGEWVRG